MDVLSSIIDITKQGIKFILTRNEKLHRTTIQQRRLIGIAQ